MAKISATTREMLTEMGITPQSPAADIYDAALDIYAQTHPVGYEASMMAWAEKVTEALLAEDVPS